MVTVPALRRLCLWLFVLASPGKSRSQRSPDPRFDRTARPGVGVADNQPVGNGEVVANVWAENGTLALLLGRSDVFSGFVQPLKLGRVLLSFDPDPFAAASASASASAGATATATATYTETGGAPAVRWDRASGTG